MHTGSEVGEIRHDPAANRDETGFTGHVRDAASGLVYAQARFYHPALGRFLSPDPVGFASGGPVHFQRYGYVGNDPVNFFDPTGLDDQPAQSTCGHGPSNCQTLGGEYRPEAQTVENEQRRPLTFGEAHPTLDELGLTQFEVRDDSVSAVEAENLIQAMGIVGAGWVGRSGVRWLGASASGARNILRHAQYRGINFRINSGHAAGRLHRTGAVRLLGVSSRQVEAAIMRQLADDITSGAAVPILGRTRPAIGEIAIGTGRVGYRYGKHPNTGEVLIATYYPIVGP